MRTRGSEKPGNGPETGRDSYIWSINTCSSFTHKIKFADKYVLVYKSICACLIDANRSKET
jgi:hypothetical protein